MSDTLDSLKQKYTELAAQSGDKLFLIEVLKAETQEIQKQMYELQKKIQVLVKGPVEPPAA